MSIRNLLVNLLALVGVIALVAGVCFWFVGDKIFGGTDLPLVQQKVVSPDGKFRAIHITSSGGGAAGWCRDFIIVQPADTQSPTPTYPDAANETVFSTRCDPEPFTMQWSADRELTIRYRLSRLELSGFELRASDKTGLVSVKFEPGA